MTPLPTIADIERSIALALQQPQPTEQQIAEAHAAGIDAMLRRHGGSAELVGVADGVATIAVMLPQPRPANPYGCYNRWLSGAPNCQYTLSALGRVDPRCTGCQWRKEAP